MNKEQRNAIEKRNIAAARDPLEGTQSKVKVLVATHEGQGARKSDFCHTIDGEPVYLGFECDGNDRVDGGCGCQRSFSGFTSHRATTTAKVVECETSSREYVERYMDTMQAAGWFKPEDRGKEQKDFEPMALEMLRIAATFKVGQVVEKRGSKIQNRRAAQ